MEAAGSEEAVSSPHRFCEPSLPQPTFERAGKCEYIGWSLGDLVGRGGLPRGVAELPPACLPNQDGRKPHLNGTPLGRHVAKRAAGIPPAPGQ